MSMIHMCRGLVRNPRILSPRPVPRSVRRRSFDVGRLARGRRRDGILARVWTSGPPDSGMEIPDRKAGTEEIRVSYAVDGHCAPRSKCVGRPAPASARGHRPHPLDVQRQAHEVPLAAHLRQASQAESSESEHLLDPPVRRLREPLALPRTGLCPRGSPVSHPCGAWQGAVVFMIWLSGSVKLLCAFGSGSP